MSDIKAKASKVREYVKNKGMRMSAKGIQKLDEKIGEILDKAIERTKGNNRQTIMPADL